MGRARWDDYVWWQTEDRKVLKRNGLSKNVSRNGNEGIGKPEALKHGFHGYWSRRITDEHPLVYKIAGDGDPDCGVPIPLRKVMVPGAAST